MSQKPNPPRGTRDFLPRALQGQPSTETWQLVESSFRRVVERHGFGEIRTPIFELAEVFTRAIGDLTDIVQKELWTFTDRKGRQLALRPEGTAAVVRATLTAGLFGSNKPLRFYYMGPMFRYERPQAGRYRQHHQAGVEYFGNSSAEADAQVIGLAMEFISELGLKNLTASINSIGCRNCRPAYTKVLKKYLSENENGPNSSKLCKFCRERGQQNPLRALDCKNPSCQEILNNAPRISEALCQECADHQGRLVRGLEAAGIEFQVVPRLVRGFDYYTRTVFEVLSQDLGAQNAVLGGGRYDYLVRELGGPEVPAVGFSSGMDRLIQLLGISKINKEKNIRTFLITLGDNARAEAWSLSKEIRKTGKGKVALVWEDLSLGLSAQLKKASSWGYGAAIILGDKEIAEKRVIVKDLGSQLAQVDCSYSEVSGELEKILNKRNYEENK